MSLPDAPLDPPIVHAEGLSPACYAGDCHLCDWDNPGACGCPHHEEGDD